MELIIVALIAAGLPLVGVMINRTWDKSDREHAYAREDAMAKKADEAAQLLAKNTAIVAKANEEIVNTVKVIHTLVNSNLTQSKQEALDSRILELAALRAHRRSLQLQNTAANDPAFISIDEAEVLAIDRIEILTIELADRKRQTELAEAQTIVANKNDPLSSPMEVTIVQAKDPVPVRVIEEEKKETP